MRTSSGNDFAPILRMTLPRWIFTVISETPIWWATCLFSRPSVTYFMICCSRPVRASYRACRSTRFEVFAAPLAIHAEGRADRVQQILVAERLLQKVDRPGLQRLDGHRYVTVAGHEDDRDADVLPDQLGLKFKATLPRQADIEHDARRCTWQVRLEECGRGAEHFDAKIDRLQQIADRFADELVVVHHQDNRFFRARAMPDRRQSLCHDAVPAAVMIQGRRCGA